MKPCRITCITRTLCWVRCKSAAYTACTCFVEHGIAPFAQAEPGRANGPQAMRGTAELLLAQFPDLRFTIEAIIAEGTLFQPGCLVKALTLGR
jgi:hypothetical protein